ncbi:heparinase II/III family protein [Bacteroidota bacterium]
MNQQPQQVAPGSAVAEVHFAREGRATFHGTLRGLQPGEYTLLLMFDGADYPFERHCRYMRHPGGATPYTFPNMVFADVPLGTRVGPWPGWRGIPEMPLVTVEAAGKLGLVRFQFWGDELTCRQVRGVVDIEVDGDLECTVTSADERLIPLRAELFPSLPFAVEPLPITLRKELAGEYPRLLVTESEISGMREQMQTTHRHIWSRIEELFASWDLPSAKTRESKAVEGPERLFGEDRAVLAAFRALLSPTADNVEFARVAFFDYLAQTEQEDFEPLRIDTQSGETLFTLCICYDWLYSHLTPDDREQSVRRLWEVAEICWGHLGYERHDYAQAHFLGCGLGLLAFSFLFWETHPRAKEWASYLRGTLLRVISMLPEDGFFPHGINLWIYEYSFLLRWLELFRVCAGDDLWGATAHWENASLFRACATSPDFRYGLTMGDPQYRVGGDSWCHYLVAARTGSGDAQWLAEKLADGPHAGVDFRHIPPRRRVYEFLYFDPSIKRLPRRSRGSVESTVHNFQDGGQVFVRTRKHDGPESLFTFRSGPPIGQQRRKAGEPGAYGHSDPANGSFLLFRHDAFLVSGPGPTYRRDTGLHNTITIDGQGQVGDSAVWLPDFYPPEMIPPCTEVRIDGATTLLFADLAPSYLPHLGVDVCTRSMMVDPDGAIVGVDTVACSSPRSIEWNLHTWGEVDEIELHVLSPDDYSRHAGLTEVVPAYPNDGTRDNFLQLSVRQRTIQWVWCIGIKENCRPELVRKARGTMISGLPGGAIRFDGKWLIPEGFDEAHA